MLKKLIKSLTFSAFLMCLLVGASKEKQPKPTKVYETFEAGPEKVRKQISRVKTRFSGSHEPQCKCPEQEGPCIQSFLDKEAQESRSKYPTMIEDYYIQNNMGNEYQGGGAVPWGIDAASVRIITVPFCPKDKDS